MYGVGRAVRRVVYSAWEGYLEVWEGCLGYMGHLSKGSV